VGTCEQRLQQGGMEEHVTVEHHEAVQEQSACRPERIQAVRLGEPVVLDERDGIDARGANAFGLAADDHDDVRDAGSLESTNLPLEQRDAADLDEALRLVARGAVETRALSGCENHASHVAGTRSRLRPTSSHSRAVYS